MIDLLKVVCIKGCVRVYVKSYLNHRNIDETYEVGEVYDIDKDHYNDAKEFFMLYNDWLALNRENHIKSILDD